MPSTVCLLQLEKRLSARLVSSVAHEHSGIQGIHSLVYAIYAIYAFAIPYLAGTGMLLLYYGRPSRPKFGGP